jgi:hypothetical protein
MWPRPFRSSGWFLASRHRISPLPLGVGQMGRGFSGGSLCNSNPCVHFSPFSLLFQGSSSHLPMGEHGSTLRQVASFPYGDVLNPTPVFAWFLIRLEQVTGERLDPCLAQRDCRYDAGSQSGLGRVPGNAALHLRAEVRTCRDDDDGSRPVARCAHLHSMRFASGSKQAYTPDANALVVR